MVMVEAVSGQEVETFGSSRIAERKRTLIGRRSPL
jgi:hypothetical protein